MITINQPWLSRSLDSTLPETNNQSLPVKIQLPGFVGFHVGRGFLMCLGPFIATFPAGWSPQKVVNSKGNPDPKMALILLQVLCWSSWPWDSVQLHRTVHNKKSWEVNTLWLLEVVSSGWQVSGVFFLWDWCGGLLFFWLGYVGRGFEL